MIYLFINPTRTCPVLIQKSRKTYVNNNKLPWIRSSINHFPDTKEMVSQILPSIRLNISTNSFDLFNEVLAFDSFKSSVISY